MLTEKDIAKARENGFVACLAFDNTKGTKNHNGHHFPNMRNGIVYHFFKEEEKDSLDKIANRLTSEFFIPVHITHF